MAACSNRQFAVSKVVCRENILIITNSRQVYAISEICANLDASQISEPVGRDTSAAIGLAAAIIMARSNGVDSSFAVFPSDHVIGDEEAFARTINTAFRIAEAGDNLITVGISPDHPATGYGYIKRGAQLEISGEKYFAVEKFFEKPNLNKAREYVESEFYWNAGMFVWRIGFHILGAAKICPKARRPSGASGLGCLRGNL
ncbi:MAG: sugar phosphate nucleotidyltransferase [Bacilli bacterium]